MAPANGSAARAQWISRCLFYFEQRGGKFLGIIGGITVRIVANAGD
jgi:hypothetical protein